jgi:putative hydrolase of HD superfamily
MQPIVKLLHEIGMLAHIPRSGFAFLGSGSQSVAEHSFRVALIAHALARLVREPLDHSKLIMMCLIHDLPEARTGDLNYVQKRYVQANVEKAIQDIEEGSSLGPEVAVWLKEYEKGETLEAQLAHDADQLELLLVLKQEAERGNAHAQEWFINAQKRLKTPIAFQLSETIWQAPTNEWWQVTKL